MFKTTAIDTLKQDKKCQPCWYIILSTMSGSTTANNTIGDAIANEEIACFKCAVIDNLFFGDYATIL